MRYKNKTVKDTNKPSLTRRDPNNTYTPSDNMSMEDIERIMSSQGGFPLDAAEVYSDSGPRKMNQQELMKALGGYGLEAARLLPFIGEALDIGDIVSAGKTGKDLSGYDATPGGRAAMFGATLAIPNIIEKPAKWLAKQGAKNADDIRRILSSYANKNTADIPADLKPLLDLSKKSNEMKLYLDQSNIPHNTKLGNPDRVKYGAEEWQYDGLVAGTPSNASVNWLVKNRPEQVLKFSPENFKKGMFDADYSDWADSYLTSLRGVEADNIDIAADAIRGPKRPMGHIHGDGTYQTSNLNILGGKGKSTGYGVGSRGYIGASRNVPGIGQKGQKASNILNEINLLEAHGGSYPIVKDASGNWLYDTNKITRDYPKGEPIQIRNPKGIHTTGDKVRIVRPNTAKLTGILDIAKSDDQGAIDALMSRYGKNIDWGGVGQFSNQDRLGLNELYEKIAQGKKYQDGGALKSLIKKYKSGGRVIKYQDGGGLGDPKKVASSDSLSTKTPINMEDLMRGISQVESSGGVASQMMNPSSSATGMYGQLYNEVKDLPELAGINRESFSKNKDLQDKIFNMRMGGELPGTPGLIDNAYDLTEEYASDIGDKWEFTLDEVAAISNYIGREGARKFFASIRDGKPLYTPSGTNKPVLEYLDRYRFGRDR